MKESSEKIEGASDARGGGGRTLRRLSDAKLCYTVPEVAELLGFSRNFGYELVRRGELPFIRFGKRILIPRLALEKMLERG